MKTLSGPSADGAEASRCVAGEQAKASGKTPRQCAKTVTGDTEPRHSTLRPLPGELSAHAHERLHGTVTGASRVTAEPECPVPPRGPDTRYSTRRGTTGPTARSTATSDTRTAEPGARCTPRAEGLTERTASKHRPEEARAVGAGAALPDLGLRAQARGPSPPGSTWHVRFPRFASAANADTAPILRTPSGFHALAL